jgi:hypothetical protein
MGNAKQVSLMIPFKNKYKLQEFMNDIFPRCSLEKSGVDNCFKVRKPEVIDNPIFMPSKTSVGRSKPLVDPAKINGASDAKQV